MGKYDPPRRFLENAVPDVSELTQSFGQIEQTLGSALPHIARHQDSWWANQKRSGTGPQASSWLDAGWGIHAVECDRK
jgi:hypothetical protein